MKKIVEHQNIQNIQPPNYLINSKISDQLYKYSKYISKLLHPIYPLIADSFSKCFLNSIFTCTEILPDGTTYVSNGDIDNMWFRDSYGQFEPYIFLAKNDLFLKKIIEGIIKRMQKYILIDPYANSFNKYPDGNNYWPTDLQKPGLWIRERKWSIDTPCSYIMLLKKYYLLTNSKKIFDDQCYIVLHKIIDLFEVEQDHQRLSDYYFIRNDPLHPNDTLVNNGLGNKISSTGMIWSAFRPSDDPCKYGFNIPLNFLAMECIKFISKIFKNIYKNKKYSKKSHRIYEKVKQGINKFGILDHPKYGTIYKYETDGLKNNLIIDDANFPNLISLPLFSKEYNKEIYINTRKFSLSLDNVYFIHGKYANGLGSMHPYNLDPTKYIWPIGLIIEALTDNSIKKKLEIINLCLETSAKTYFIHEAFDSNNPNNYHRGWCPWNNSQYALLVLQWLTKKKIIKYQFLK